MGFTNDSFVSLGWDSIWENLWDCHWRKETKRPSCNKNSCSTWIKLRIL